MYCDKFCVVQYRNGKREGALAGIGRNRGTLDSGHARSSAYRHKRDLEKENWRKTAGLTYKVETSY